MACIPTCSAPLTIGSKSSKNTASSGEISSLSRARVYMAGFGFRSPTSEERITVSNILLSGIAVSQAGIHSLTLLETIAVIQSVVANSLAKAIISRLGLKACPKKYSESGCSNTRASCSTGPSDARNSSSVTSPRSSLWPISSVSSSPRKTGMSASASKSIFASIATAVSRIMCP